VLGGLLIFFFVIEGQGRTLEEIDTMYLLNVKPWQSSKWIAPPPSEIAATHKTAGNDDAAEAGEASGPTSAPGEAAPEPKDSIDSASTGEGEKEAEHRQ